MYAWCLQQRIESCVEYACDMCVDECVFDAEEERAGGGVGEVGEGTIGFESETTMDLRSERKHVTRVPCNRYPMHP